MESRRLRILIADDHTIMRTGLASWLEHTGEFEIVAQASNGEEAIALWRQHRPDVILTDLRMPQTGGIAAITQIKRENPDANIVILTTFDGDEDVYRGMRAGAKGYILKDARPEELIDCIRAVSRGQGYIPPQIAAKLVSRFALLELTARELEILQHVANGESNKRIAAQLAITEGTVKTHMAQVLAKLDVTSRTEAVAVARRRGLIDE